MPTAFITGATGQDGSYLTEKLALEGWEVHGLVRDGDSQPDGESPLVAHAGDLTDHDGVARLLDEIEPDHIYNLGGLSSVSASWEQPVQAAVINGVAAVGLMEATWRLQERLGRGISFVQASSGEIFGSPAQVPQDEETPLRPVNPYGASKALAHLACHVYRQRGLHASSLILYNHESPRRPGQFVTRKISLAVAAIVAGSGGPLTLGNLDARRDWGWAPDYVDAMWRAANHLEPADFVIATGQSHSVREFVAAAFAHVGIEAWEAHVRVDPAFVRPADAVELRGDPSRAEDILGWRPAVSFTEIVARMVDHDLV